MDVLRAVSKKVLKYYETIFIKICELLHNVEENYSPYTSPIKHQVS